MSNVNVQNLFILLVLVSLLQRIRSDDENWDNFGRQRKIASGARLENNFGKSLVETAITTAITVDDENFDDNELKKLFKRNFKFYENLVRARNHFEWPEDRPRRKSRQVMNSTTSVGMDCFTCFANTSSKADESCYEGVNMATKRCADAEHCFTELNPQYIKRGCVLPGRINRTFICKCPLCNDKPSFDISHFEYKKLTDWEYDNARLQSPLVGMDLMCKVCETKGTNPTSDKNCRFGKNADYMVCAHNQLCFTNVDDETDFVSRGCIEKPLYNSIYFFCNNSECNTEKFSNPTETLRLRATEIRLKEDPTREKIMSSYASKLCNVYLYLMLMFAFVNIILI